MDQFLLQRRNVVIILLLCFFATPHHCFVSNSQDKVHGACNSIRCSEDTECLEHKGEASCYNTTCPVDEVFLLCSSGCEPTCESTTETCKNSCGPPSCQCRPGFVRKNGKCINRKKCPKTPTKSETPSLLRETSLSRLTAFRCIALQDITVKQFLDNRSVCLTLEIAKWDIMDLVVLALNPTCAMVDIDCLPGYHCEDTSTGMKCAPDRAPSQESKSSCALLECPEGEYCEVLDEGPRCVVLSELCAAVVCATGQCVEFSGNFGCFNTTCGLHEEFKKCANCEPTCERKQKPCANECLTPACQCVQGYVRHRGRCIKSENCEKFADYGKFSKRFFPNT
ncbi:hypothetical protein RB195_015520 [Necator americanus]|uniref:EGF-like domain-containing protein n=1 Tax=Necator americanus TaxID=51031 RepID=A0ABR1E4Y6_NECAM